ncbi:uncharacterized protein [Rutidosis leptorrhynchoides]|uniref:uncharacterized protein n=1 Tax=Rutidosis leptorrhynchoides TaxID=125765 RepID=UPI003A991D94
MEDNNKSQKLLTEIPVFTVLKNNSTLKNIFLFHKQQSSNNQDFDEQILLVGRHPNCYIVLEHPSISRYHLRIHSNPSKHSVSVFDLSSVHGTWVSGKRIEPGVLVDLKEGDEVKLGGSSRVYELHWFPITRAYDSDGKFMSTIYTIKEQEEETNQDEKVELHMSRDEFKCSGLSFSPVKKMDMMTLSDLDCLTSSCDDIEAECSSQFKAGNGTVYGIEDSDGLNASKNQSNWSSDEVGDSLKMLNREGGKDGPLSCDDTNSFQATLAVSETVSKFEDSVGLTKCEDELNWLKDNLINELELQDDGIVEEIPFSVPKCWLSESADGMNWLRDNFSNEFELQNHEMINKSPDMRMKKPNLLTASDPNCLTSSCDDTEVECLSPSKTGEGVITGIEDSDGPNTSENQSYFSGDNISDELKMANHELKSSCADTALFQSLLVASETIPATQDSVSVNFSEDELNWVMDNLSNEFELQKGESIKEDTIFALNFPLSGSEDGLDWVRDNLSDESDMENHNIINKDPFSVTNCSESLCDDTDIETFATVQVGFSETIYAIEDSIGLNDSNSRLNLLEDISNDDFKLIHDVFSLPMCSQSSCYEDEPVNQQTINKVSVNVAHSDDVNVDEDGCFMPDTAESKENIIDSEYDQMNHITMSNESEVSSVLIDGADMGNNLESVDHEIMKKESVFIALDQEQSYTPDISRAKDIRMNQEVLKSVSVSMNLSDTINGNELEMFTPDKENKNPNTFSVKSLKKGWMEDVRSPTVNEKKDDIPILQESLTLNDVDKVDPVVCDEEALFSLSEKETKSRQSENKRWTMVVDTSSLLHAQSSKHLKLLEGLKGTQIVIPKTVIRELMYIKSQGNIVARNTERVSLALKWIDECIANTELEFEVVETALHLRKEVTDRKIIILSNDLTLKIKAMAEGIMCEEAEEFHKSLVNPFSERFMWVGSSAIGLTWSCVNDDDILKQKYQGCDANGSQGLKGLKLLAHDATFRQEVKSPCLLSLLMMLV